MSGDTHSAENLVNHALEFREQGRFDDALQSLRAALEQDPDHVQATGELAITLGQMGRLPSALEVLGQAISRHKNNSWLLTNRAIAHGLAGKFDAAIADFDRVFPSFVTAPFCCKNVCCRVRL